MDQLKNHFDHSKRIELKRNQFLTVKGSRDTNLYLIEKGAVHVYVENEDSEHSIRFGYEGNFITAMDSFLSNAPTQFYIQAIRNCTISVLSKETLNEVLKADEELSIAWNVLLKETIIQQLEREVDLLTKSPKERYRRVKKRSPKLFQEIPNRYIASYLRMTPETLSRIEKS